MRHALLALVSLAVLPSPAWAAPADCDDVVPGVHISMGFHIGAPYTQDEQELFDKMHLRQQGVVARETRRTSEGCIEAWVPDGQGGFTTEYYDPRTFDGQTFDADTFRLRPN